MLANDPRVLRAIELLATGMSGRKATQDPGTTFPVVVAVMGNQFYACDDCDTECLCAQSKKVWLSKTEFYCPECVDKTFSTSVSPPEFGDTPLYQKFVLEV